VAIPANFLVSRPFWSPDGRRIAFTHAGNSAIELWIVDSKTGDAKSIAGVRLNGALTGRGPGSDTCSWMPDSKNLLGQTVPAGRGAPPNPPAVPIGPPLQEGLGKAAPVPTFEDLLDNDHDSDLFDYYATAQLALLNS